MLVFELVNVGSILEEEGIFDHTKEATISSFAGWELKPGARVRCLRYLSSAIETLLYENMCTTLTFVYARGTFSFPPPPLPAQRLDKYPHSSKYVIVGYSPILFFSSSLASVYIRRANKPAVNNPMINQSTIVVSFAGFTLTVR